MEAQEDKELDDSNVKIILRSIADATGIDASELADDTVIADAGVDSIMAIEIAANVKDKGVDLAPTFVSECLTIGDLRSRFRSAPSKQITSKTFSVATSVTDTRPDERASSVATSVTNTPRNEKASSTNEEEFPMVLDSLVMATACDPSELSDDTEIADTGVDSIMAIEIAAAAKEKGVELAATFCFEYVTIVDLRRKFAGTGCDTENSSPCISNP